MFFALQQNAMLRPLAVGYNLAIVIPDVFFFNFKKEL